MDESLIGPYKCPSVYAAPLKHGRDMTSSPRPDSAADPEPGGDPGSGSAGRDCIASPPLGWMDTV